MSSKLIIIIVVILLQAVFAGLNIKNISDISLGFATFKDIPVFLTITVSFIAGAAIVFPFAYISGRKRKKKIENTSEGKNKKLQKKNENSNPDNFA